MTQQLPPLKKPKGKKLKPLSGESSRGSILVGVGLAIVGLAIAVGLILFAVSNGESENLLADGEGLECSKRLALPGVKALLDRQGEDGPPLLDEQTGQIADFVYSKVVDCVDLNSDGAQELILLADGVNAGGSHPVSWFILEQKDGKWKGVFRRTVPTPQIDVQDEAILESTPGYLEDAPMGAPSYRRLGRIVYRNGSFEFVQRGQGTLDREVVISPETKRVTRLGSLEVESAEPQDAREVFGRPSSFSGYESEVCPTYWSDLGLEIGFANLGGLDACVEGLVSSLSLTGSAAETAGWAGPKGIRIGMTFNEVLEQFPSTSRSEYAYEPPGVEPDWESWTILEGPSPFTDDGKTPTIDGYFDGDRLRKLVFYVGAAGE